MPKLSSMKYSRLNLGGYARCVTLLGCWCACLGVAEAGAPVRVTTDRPFADVPANHWAYDAVEELRKLGIFTGYPPQPARAVDERVPERPPVVRLAPKQRPLRRPAIPRKRRR